MRTLTIFISLLLTACAAALKTPSRAASPPLIIKSESQTTTSTTAAADKPSVVYVVYHNPFASSPPIRADEAGSLTVFSILCVLKKQEREGTSGIGWTRHPVSGEVAIVFPKECLAATRDSYEGAEQEYVLWAYSMLADQYLNRDGQADRNEYRVLFFDILVTLARIDNNLQLDSLDPLDRERLLPRLKAKIERIKKHLLLDSVPDPVPLTWSKP